MTEWRRLLDCWIPRRTVAPEDEPILIALASRAVAHGHKGSPVACASCGGFGPAEAAAVVWIIPPKDGGERHQDNARVWCKGCLIDSGRSDYLQATAGAAIAKRQRGADAIMVL